MASADRQEQGALQWGVAELRDGTTAALAVTASAAGGGGSRSLPPLLLKPHVAPVQNLVTPHLRGREHHGAHGRAAVWSQPPAQHGTVAALLGGSAFSEVARNKPPRAEGGREDDQISCRLNLRRVVDEPLPVALSLPLPRPVSNNSGPAEVSHSMKARAMQRFLPAATQPDVPENGEMDARVVGKVVRHAPQEQPSVASGLGQRRAVCHLLLLPEVIFLRVYSFVPELVAPHMAVCRFFSGELRKAQRAHFRMRSAPGPLQIAAMWRFEGSVYLSVEDRGGRSNLAARLVDVVRGGKTLAPNSRGWRNLTGLDLSSNRLSRAGLDRLAESLPMCAGLRAMNLNDNQMGGPGLRVALGGLPKGQRLLSLHLRGNALGGHGVAVLCGEMRPARLAYLQKLDLAENKIGSRELRLLGAAFKAANANRLMQLDLSKNVFDGLSVGHLAVGLQFCTSLTSLSMASNKYFGAPGARSLGQILTNNSRLASLDLSCTALYPEGLAALKTPMQACAGLERVSLASNYIGEKGSRYLREMFANATSLSTLDLSFNSFNKNAGPHLVDLVRSQTHLR